MIYPNFLKDGCFIGICAPSGGIPKSKGEAFALSLKNLEKSGFRLSVFQSIYTEDYPSASPICRGDDFNKLVKSHEADMIMCAAGGDFLIEMLPYVDFDAFCQSPKWIQGYSDPTSLLFSVTTRLDIATIYGCNAGGFDMPSLHGSLINNIKILKGEILPQRSFDMYESQKSSDFMGYKLDTPVYWNTPNGSFNACGRLIGGCLDCLNFIFDTEFDGSEGFIKKYSQDGFIWYFDIFSLSPSNVFNSLWKMKSKGLFKNTSAFLFGRIMFPQNDFLSYEEAILRALGNVNIAFDCDIGHVNPKMTLINGALANIECKDGAAVLNMQLV